MSHGGWVARVKLLQEISSKSSLGQPVENNITADGASMVSTVMSPLTQNVQKVEKKIKVKKKRKKEQNVKKRFDGDLPL